MNTDINTSNIFEKWLDYCNLRIRTYQKNVWVLENNKSNIYSLQDVIYINNTNPYDVIIYELGLKNVQKIFILLFSNFFACTKIHESCLSRFFDSIFYFIIEKG